MTTSPKSERPAPRWVTVAMGVPVAMLAVLVGVAVDSPAGTVVVAMAILTAVAIRRRNAPRAVRVSGSVLMQLRAHRALPTRYP